MRIIAVPLLFLIVSAPSLACVGDCDGDATVAVGEIIRGVNIALGISPIESCPAFAGPGDTGVSVSRLVSAVNAALYGCLGGETPTIHASPTLTPTKYRLHQSHRVTTCESVSHPDAHATNYGS